MEGAQAVVVVFALDDLTTHKHIYEDASGDKENGILENTYQYIDEDVPVYIVGTKNDLAPDVDLAPLKEQAGDNPFFSTSAMTGDNVDTVFNTII